MDYSSFDLSDDEKQAGSPTPKSSRIVRLIIKGLSVALIILLLPFVTSHCLPLLKPVGVSMLQRLWDVLRFIVITTAVSFGILNSQWKAIERADPWKEDDDRHPRASRLNHAIFNEMEDLKSTAHFASDFSDESTTIIRPILEISDAGPRKKAASKNHCEAHKIANSADIKRSATGPVEEEFQAKSLVNARIASESCESAVGSGGNIQVLQVDDVDISKRNATEEATDHSIAGSSSKGRHLSGENYSRGLTVPPISEGLTAVTKINFRSTSVSKDRPIVHRSIATRPDLNDDKPRRRSSSVERPVQRQSPKVSNSADVDASKTVNVKDFDPILKTHVQAKATPHYERRELASVSNLVSSSRHSRSALNLDQLTRNERIVKSSRRNISLSYDFGDDYSPEWLDDYPPPPPPLIEPSDSETEASSPIAKTLSSPFAKAVSPRIAPWRSLPVDIAPRTNPIVSQPPSAAMVEEPAPTSVSPSPGELNKKADAFIARFYEQIRMQRVESFERRRAQARSVRRGYNY